MQAKAVDERAQCRIGGLVAHDERPLDPQPATANPDGVEISHEMTMTPSRAEIIHISIDASVEAMAAFLRDVTTWTSWAPWIRAVSTTAEGRWSLDTEAGLMQVELVEPNALGVLDHRVTLESGLVVFNAMRVVTNGSGSELMMVIFQQPTVSALEFERDVQAVREDLVRLKQAAELWCGRR